MKMTMKIMMTKGMVVWWRGTCGDENDDNVSSDVK